jgi:undecaprenyl-diphosphatase
MNAYLQILMDWLNQHPTWSGLIVFVVSLLESLVVIGLFIPGALVMFGVGALASVGVLALWPMLLWASAGAVIGDTLSYALGYRYQSHLRAVWPFHRYPHWLKRGEEFFRRHGGKSIVFGRFIGPVRPVVPVVAGMLQMPPNRFLTADILAALFWSPAYALPGVAFGASLRLASEVTTRLVVIALFLWTLLGSACGESVPW